MERSFRSHWQYVGVDIFERFSLQFADDPEEGIPQDLFAALADQLLLACERYVHSEVWRSAEELLDLQDHLEALQDDEELENAYSVMRNLVLPDTVPDLAIIAFMEESVRLVTEEYSDEWGAFFGQCVIDFITKFNLGYKVKNSFKLQRLITPQVDRLYQALSENSGPHGDLFQLVEEFEDAYTGALHNGGDLKIPLSKGSILLEAIAADMLEVNRDSLGSVLTLYEKQKLFPHKGSIKGSLDKLYGFVSDYPGIRHAGSPKAKNRDIALCDLDHFGLQFILWAGYLQSVKALKDNEGSAEG